MSRPLVVGLLILLPLAACSPEHAKSTGFLSWKPDPGYAWANPDSLIKKTRWTEGEVHPDHANLLSSAGEGFWAPRPGYEWGPTMTMKTPLPNNNPRTLDKDLAVHWQPGIHRNDFAHVTSSMEAGFWAPDLGYDFTDKASLRVAWKEGSAHPVN